MYLSTAKDKVNKYRDEEKGGGEEGGFMSANVRMLIPSCFATLVGFSRMDRVPHHPLRNV